MSLNSNFTAEKSKYLVDLLKNRKSRTVRINPLNATSFTPGQNTKIRITGDGYLDMANSYISFTLSMATPTATEVLKHTPNAESFIKRMVITAESTGAEIENFDHRDVLQNMLLRHTVGRDVDNSERKALNGALGDNPELGAGNAAAGIVFPIAALAKDGEMVMNQTVGFMGAGKHIPLHFMGSILLDFDWNALNILDESVVIVADPFTNVAAGPITMTFSNVQFVAQMVDYGEEFDQMIREQVEGEGLHINYDTYISAVDNQSAPSFTSKMNVSSNSVKGIYTVFRKSTDARATTRAKVRGHAYQFTSGAGTSYQYKVNDRLYPSYLASVGNQSYAELMVALNRLGDVSTGSYVDKMAIADGGAVDWDAFTNAATHALTRSYMGGSSGAGAVGTVGSFALGVNLEEAGEGSQLQSGVSTKGNSLDVELTYNRTAGDALIINHFVHVDKILQIKAGREVNVLS